MEIKGVKTGPLPLGGGVLFMAARVLRIDHKWIARCNFSFAPAAAPMFANKGT